MSWADLYCIWTMRQTLLKSNRELWRQSEEQKRLKAAFPHDLRNPITVLKGSIEMANNHAVSGTEKRSCFLQPLFVCLLTKITNGNKNLSLSKNHL